MSTAFKRKEKKKSFKQKFNYLEMFSVVLVYNSKEDTHKDVITQQDEDHKEYYVETIPVIGWHPTKYIRS